ncbi:unnamed protein product [Arabidopsis lyrata]|nr:unnamed protein product [Arabidopsis lyrata]
MPFPREGETDITRGTPFPREGETGVTLLLNFNFKLPNGMKADEINMDVMTGLAMHKSQHLKLVPEKVNK